MKYQLWSFNELGDSSLTVEYAANEPATGNKTAISPRAWIVQNSINPTNANAMRTFAGPPFSFSMRE